MSTVKLGFKVVRHEIRSKVQVVESFKIKNGIVFYIYQRPLTAPQKETDPHLTFYTILDTFYEQARDILATLVMVSI